MREPRDCDPTDDPCRCSRCKENKPAAAFGFNRRRYNGRSSTCKPCAVQATAEWQRKYPEKVAARNKRWKDAHPEQVASYAHYHSRKSRLLKKETDPEGLRYRERMITLKRMGMTREQYQAMWDAQGHRCAICRREKGDSEKEFAIDHDHGCCKPKTACTRCHRGLLCSGCNTALHKLETMDGWMEEALAYLNRFKKEVQ